MPTQLFSSKQRAALAAFPEAISDLLTNAVIAWNTIYIGHIQQHLASQGKPLTDEAIRHTSPTIRAHLNVYGRYDLHAIQTPKTGQFRPLRKA